MPEPKKEKTAPPADQVLDGQCQAVINVAENAVVSWFLMASFLYYIHDISILSDPFYDQLTKRFLNDYDRLTHPHKELITKDDLAAGTLYNLRADQYPGMTKGAAARLALTATGIRLPY